MITNELKRKLGLYSMASGAMLAMANHVNAQVSHADISPDGSVSTSNTNYMIDLNGDATDDFKIYLDNQGSSTVLYISPLNSGGIVGGAGTNGFSYVATPLSTNDQINGAKEWVASAMMAVKGAGSNFGNFKSVTNKYVGLRIKSGADFYYGWIKLDVSIANQTVTIKEKAYNTTVNTSLKAGQTSGTGSTTAIEQSQELASQTNVFVDANNEISVNNNSGKTVSAVLMNSTGVKVMTKEIASGLTVLPSSNLTAGIYILNITVGEAIVSKKFVIR